MANSKSMRDFRPKLQGKVYRQRGYYMERRKHCVQYLGSEERLKFLGKIFSLFENQN